MSEPSRIKADFSFFSEDDRVRGVRVRTLIGLTALRCLTTQMVRMEGREE